MALQIEIKDKKMERICHNSNCSTHSYDDETYERECPHEPIAKADKEIEVTLQKLLEDIGINLDQRQLECVQAIDKGRTVALYDVSGNIVGRFKGSVAKYANIDVTVALSTGNIAQDVLYFMGNRWPTILDRAIAQGFADELYIYLKNCKWPEETIVYAIERTLSQFNPGQYRK